MIQGQYIYLRGLEKKDLDYLWEWHNNSFIASFASSNPFSTVTREQLERSYFSENSKSNYAICINEGTLIGEISYWTPNRLFPSTVEVGTLIGEEKYRNLGVGYEALLLIAKAVFSNQRINRISIIVSDHNYLSKIPLEKSCIVKEGIIRKDRFINGGYYDSIVFGILRNEYFKFIKENNDIENSRLGQCAQFLPG